MKEKEKGAVETGTIPKDGKKHFRYNLNNENLTVGNFVPVQFVQQKNAAREVSRMAYEILKSIVEAEARAGEIKQQAVAQAEELKANALKQQESLLDQAKLQGKKEMQDAVEQAVTDSQQTVLEILEEADEACAKIKEQASRKKEEAVAAVIGKVVGTYGSC